MRLTFRLAALTTVIASAYAGGSLLAACGGGGNNKDGGADSSTDTGVKKDSGVKDTGTGSDAGDDAPAVPLLDPACNAPVTAGSNGTCVTIDGNAFMCNPVTNQGCDGGAGEACDLGDNGSGGSAFGCFAPPNDVALCGSCDNQAGPFCKPTLHCVEEDGGGFGCGRWCCDDTDCTPGHCDTSYLGQAPGICVK